MSRDLKVYYYTMKEMGLPEGTQRTRLLRGPGVQRVKRAAEATVFYVPAHLFDLLGNGCGWQGLPYLQGNEARHVILNIAEVENLTTPPGTIAFRCDCTQEVQKRHPRTVSWPWPVNDFGEYIPHRERRDGPIFYDCCFHGWTFHRIARHAAQALENAPNLRCSLRLDNRYYGTDIPAEEKWEYRYLMAGAFAHSACSISPVNRDGIIRYRFYESMSAARPIIHINDNCVYPLAAKIDYERFVAHVREEDVGSLADRVRNVRSLWTDEHILLVGQDARMAYRRYLDTAVWPRVAQEIVREMIG